MVSCGRPILTVILLVLWTGAFAVAAGGQWASIGPDGGFVQGLVINPQNPTTLYAGTDRAGIYQSTDGASSWQLMNGGLPTDQSIQIREMVIHPITPQVLYAATGWDVVKSTDGAQTWNQVNDRISDENIPGGL